MVTVPVHLGERSYDILIGENLLSRGGELMRPVLRGKKLLLAMDANVERPHGEVLAKSLSAADYAVETMVLPAGEETKSVTQLSAIWDRLVGLRYGRDCAVVALGGGVIGDLVGFAAASFLRGVDFVQVPTTLLAMVDSSVGGKTGINHPLGKNLLGAFWQPRLVLADTKTLDTLPRGECNSALAEIIKYGVIYDAEFFVWLERNAAKVRDREPEALAHAIRRSCEIKAEVVSQDEHETTGLREILNFGHTVGHAIENSAGYGKLRHGEAIAIGMVAEGLLGIGRAGDWTQREQDRLTRLIAAVELPYELAEGMNLSIQTLQAAAKSDKKNRAGTVRYMVPMKIGRVENVALTDEETAPVLKAVGAKE